MTSLTKFASLFDPETPVRDQQKAYEVAQARQNPALRDFIDNNSKTELSTAEKYPEVFGAIGGTLKNVGLATALGTAAYGAYKHLDGPAFDINDLNAINSEYVTPMLAGLGAAAVGRYMQEPTKRSLADVKDNNYVPSYQDNVRSTLNQSYTLGNKQPGSEDYTIDLDRAHAALRVARGDYNTKAASTDSINMPEREQPNVSYDGIATTTSVGYESNNIPDRTAFIPFNITKAACDLGFSKEGITELLNATVGLNKTAGAAVLAKAMSASYEPTKSTTQSESQVDNTAEAQAADVVIDDTGDYDLVNKYPKEKQRDYHMDYQLFIPMYRR